MDAFVASYLREYFDLLYKNFDPRHMTVRLAKGEVYIGPMRTLARPGHNPRVAPTPLTFAFPRSRGPVGRAVGGNDLILRELLGYETLDVTHFHISECLVNVRGCPDASVSFQRRHPSRYLISLYCRPSAAPRRTPRRANQISPTKISTVPTYIELGVIDIVLTVRGRNPVPAP